MRKVFGVCLVCAVVVSIAFTSAPSNAQSPSPLRAAGSIPLPNVSGRIDHLAFDAGRQRLFVAALGNDTVEVLDTAKGVHVRSLSAFREPQGIAAVPDLNAVAVANGESGTLQLVDAQTLQIRWTTKIAGDADNVRYDPAAKQLFVAAVGGIFVVDPGSGKVANRIPINGHPESFQLEAQGPRLFANLPGGSQVIAADRRSMNVLARWAAGGCGANYPMALDEGSHRLFVGCRRPAAVAIFDTESGKLIGTVAGVGDTDDLFYDAERKRLYVIGGEGAVDVFARDGDALRRIAHLPTRDGARTGLWVSSQSRLYVAVPARNGRPAEIRVFEAQG